GSRRGGASWRAPRSAATAWGHERSMENCAGGRRDRPPGLPRLPAFAHAQRPAPGAHGGVRPEVGATIGAAAAPALPAAPGGARGRAGPRVAVRGTHRPACAAGTGRRAAAGGGIMWRRIEVDGCTWEAR